MSYPLHIKHKFPLLLTFPLLQVHIKIASHFLIKTIPLTGPIVKFCQSRELNISFP